MYFSGEIGQEISERLYQSVAVVLAYIHRVDKGEDLEQPDVELPADLRFNEYGNLMSEKQMRKHRSLGEMISTATFWDAGVHIPLRHGITQYGTSFASLYWVCRGFFLYFRWIRFAIANLVNKWRKS